MTMIDQQFWRLVTYVLMRVLWVYNVFKLLIMVLEVSVLRLQEFWSQISKNVWDVRK